MHNRELILEILEQIYGSIQKVIIGNSNKKNV